MDIIDVKDIKRERADKTLNVSESTKRLVLSLKKYERETVDDVIRKMAENYMATQPQ